MSPEFWPKTIWRQISENEPSYIYEGLDSNRDFLGCASVWHLIDRVTGGPEKAHRAIVPDVE